MKARCALALALVAAGCQLVAPFGTDELRCPCPETHECVEDRCVLDDGTERSLARCRDGVDNDGDGATDCNDAGCVEAGSCEPYETECDPLTNEGCTAGLICALTRNAVGDVATFCRQAGHQPVGSVCQRDGDRQDTCVPGTACVLHDTDADAICQQLCGQDGDCPDHSLCAFELQGVDLGLGLCTMPCLPWDPGARCPSTPEGTYACFPIGVEPSAPETEGEWSTEGGWTTACLYPGGRAFEGTLSRGEACVVGSSERAETCEADLFCAAVAGQTWCLRYCDADGTPPAGCAPCLSIRPDPDLDVTIPTADGRTLGVCYGDAPP